MRKLLLTGAAAGTMLAAPAVAAADEQIRSQAPNRYVNPNVTIDQGERLTLFNEDRVKHDVTASQVEEGKPIFATPLLGQNEEAFVEGSQYLTTGSYQYYCSIHTSMMGTITVTSAGTPVPKPGATPPPGGDTTKPAVSARVTNRSRKALAIRVVVDEAASLVLVVKRGTKRVGRATASVSKPGRKTVSVKLKGVRKGTKLTISVRATDAAKNVGKASLSTTAR